MLLPISRIGQRRSATRAPEEVWRSGDFPKWMSPFSLPLRKTKAINSPSAAAVSRSLLRLQPAFKKDKQLPYYDSPVTNRHTPFPGDFHNRQINRFSYSVVRGVNGLRFGMPNISLYPSILIPKTEYTHLLITRLSFRTLKTIPSRKTIGYTASRGRLCQSWTAGKILSVIRLIRLAEASTP